MNPVREEMLAAGTEQKYWNVTLNGSMTAALDLKFHPNNRLELFQEFYPIGIGVWISVRGLCSSI